MWAPPAANAPDGRAARRAGHQGAGQGSAAGCPDRGVVGQQLGQQLHRVQSACAADESGECGVRGGERLEDQIVTGAQMGTLVAEDRGNLGLGERVQRAFADHHSAADAGQTVGQRLRHFQDAQVTLRAQARAETASRRHAEQIDEHAVMGAAPTRRDGDPDDGHRQPSADQQRERENRDIQQPQRPAEPTDFGGWAWRLAARPGPGRNNRLAIAIPALNADRTAATAIACQSTIAARGARSGHVARDSRAGTGPTSITARVVKASPDTCQSPSALGPSATRRRVPVA